MPKWKRWLSDQSWEEWADFLDSGVRKLEQVPPDSQQWPLAILKENAHSELQQEGSQKNQPQDTLLLTKERQECMVC